METEAAPPVNLKYKEKDEQIPWQSPVARLH